jgi:hypothetical protein
VVEAIKEAELLPAAERDRRNGLLDDPGASAVLRLVEPCA